MLRDRHEAGRSLAERLAHYRGSGALVVALPRGGVIVGLEIARALDLALDIIAVRKIGHPDSPEYAVAAVDESGEILYGEVAASLDPRWLKAAIENERQEAVRRSVEYRGDRTPPETAGKTVILVDDGAATGLTFKLALSSLRKKRAAKIIAALPVAPTEAVLELTRFADELCLLEDPEMFRGAVGAHYEHFEQVTDEEVIAALAASARL